MLLLMLGIAIVLGAGVGFLGHRKGRSFIGWFLYGTLLSPIAIVHVLLVSDLRQHWEPKRFGLPDKPRPCTYCGSAVSADALVCRQCRHSLYDYDVEAGAVPKTAGVAGRGENEKEPQRGEAVTPAAAVEQANRPKSAAAARREQVDAGVAAWLEESFGRLEQDALRNTEKREAEKEQERKREVEKAAEAAAQRAREAEAKTQRELQKKEEARRREAEKAAEAIVVRARDEAAQTMRDVQKKDEERKREAAKEAEKIVALAREEAQRILREAQKREEESRREAERAIEAAAARAREAERAAEAAAARAREEAALREAQRREDERRRQVERAAEAPAAEAAAQALRAQSERVVAEPKPELKVVSAEAAARTAEEVARKAKTAPRVEPKVAKAGAGLGSADNVRRLKPLRASDIPADRKAVGSAAGPSSVSSLEVGFDKLGVAPRMAVAAIAAVLVLAVVLNYGPKIADLDLPFFSTGTETVVASAKPEQPGLAPPATVAPVAPQATESATTSAPREITPEAKPEPAVREAVPVEKPPVMLPKPAAKPEPAPTAVAAAPKEEVKAPEAAIAASEPDAKEEEVAKVPETEAEPEKPAAKVAAATPPRARPAPAPAPKPRPTQAAVPANEDLFTMIKRVLATTGKPSSDLVRSSSAQAAVSGDAGLASGSMVAQVQRKLIEKGFNPGSADGQVGPRTRTAIREYRRSLGLEPSESIDTALMQQLGLSGPQLHPFQSPD